MPNPTSARLDLSVWRNDDVCEIPIRVIGPNLTGVAMRGQVRMEGDTPGTALAALALVTNGNAEGVRLAGAYQVAGAWHNDVRLRFNKSTRQALPYGGELGDDTLLRWAFQIDGRTRLQGDFRVLAHVIDSDAAPTGRAGYGFSQRSAGGGALSGATVTISDDGGIVLAIDGGDLVGRQVAEAADLVAQAERHLRDFPDYYVGLSGGTTPSIPFASIAANDIDPGVKALYASGATRGQMIEDTGMTDADVAAQPRMIAKAQNGRFFRRDEAFIDLRQAGLQYADRSDPTAFASAAANNTGAFLEAMAYLRRFGSNNSAIYRGTPRIKLPAERFPLGRIPIKQTVIVQGDGVGLEGGFGTLIEFTATGGFTIDRADTLNGELVPATTGGDGSMLLNFAMVGGAQPTGENGNKGILLKARAQLRDLYVANFAGIGIHSFANATAGDASHGNANLAGMQSVTTDGNWHGIKLEYADANAGLLLACNANNNASCGIWDASFLGNTHVGHHTSGNGISVDGKFVMVSRGGLRYVPAFGADALWSTTPPGTNSNVWKAFEAGGPIGLGLPEWYSGIPVKFGAAFAATDRNARSLWLGCYTEGTQAAAQIQWPSLAMGGFLNNVGDGMYLNGEQRAMQAAFFRAGNAFLDSERGALGVSGVNVPDFLIQPQANGTVRHNFGGNDSFTTMVEHGPGTSDPRGPNSVSFNNWIGTFDGGGLGGFVNSIPTVNVPFKAMQFNGARAATTDPAGWTNIPGTTTWFPFGAQTA